MFDYIKSIFSPKPTFGTGALGTVPDSRNIPLGLVQSPITIPDSLITDLSMLGVENQQDKPSCVGYSVSKLAEYYIYKQTGKVVKLSARALYDECKLQDGIPDAAGTYAALAAKILVDMGIPTDDQLPDDPTLPLGQYLGALATVPYGNNQKVTTGYAFVDPTFEAVTQAIAQNGVVTVGLFIDSNWFSGIIGKALAYIGGHQTLWHGYDKSVTRVFGLNQWGTSWIGKIAGVLDARVKPGFYEAQFADIQGAIINIIAFLPIPQNILYDVKTTGYHFVTTMHLGMTSYEILQLQKKLNITPQTGYFGPVTQARVKQWQSENELYPDGVIGVAGRRVLNVGTTLLTTDNIKQIIQTVANQNGVEPELALAVAEFESSFNPLNTLANKDPKTGVVTSVDRGLYQWNSKYHAEITDDMAFDPSTCTLLFCKAVKDGQLHANWSASEPNWKKVLSPVLLKKYGITP